MKSVLLLIALVVLGAAVIYFIPSESQAPTNVVDFDSCMQAGYPVMESDPRQCKTPDNKLFVEQKPNADVVILQPEFGALVTSPIVIKGQVRGTWFFEANIPIILKDDKGNVLVQKGYMTSDNWMTTDLINIDTTLEFPTPTTEFGVLIIHNDNPSGLPENDKEYVIPVRFK
jgi:hypothetical protein